MTNIKYTICIISIFFLKYIQATTNQTDLPHLIQDTASKVKAEAAAAIASDQQAQQQIMHILTSVTGAMQLSFSFFKSFFGYLYTIVATLCYPFIWIVGYLWRQFVTKPFGLFMHVAQVFYPVTLFCIAAICCGLFIGGVAGFAAEAFSSILISATWGPQPPKKKEAEEQDEEVVTMVAVEDQRKMNKKKGKSSTVSTEDEDDLVEETDYDLEEEESSNLKRSASAASSIWESGSSFFGVHQTSKKSLEKEPMKKVESWRNHSASSSVSSVSTTLPPPVLIRRMKLSPIAKMKKLNSGWDWDEEDSASHQDHHGDAEAEEEEEEEEEELYYPNSSSKKKRF